MRWATVTDATTAGVWIRAGWTDPAGLGPLPAIGRANPGDAVLIDRTADGEMVAVCGRPLPSATDDDDKTIQLMGAL